MRDKVLNLPNSDFNEKYSIILLKRLRRAIISHRKELDINNFAGAYELAFPQLMRLYWIFKSLQHKFRK